MSNRKRLSVEELKETELQILKEVANFCENSNISYFMDGGTLLGAARHKGFIPWDDDIDIMMLRDDYEKFAATFNEANKKYQLCRYENTEGFLYQFGKVIDCDTELYEPDEDGIKLNVNIDIFVFDNAPDNSMKLVLMLWRRDLFRTCHSIRNNMIVLRQGSAKSYIIRFIHTMLKVFPSDFFIKAMIRNAIRYNDRTTHRVGNFMGWRPTVVDRSLYQSSVELEFEGIFFKAPVGYKEFLDISYGNYMALPPKEQRVTHHNFVAYRRVGGESKFEGEEQQFNYCK